MQLNLEPCPQVIADVNRIEQVVLNLISNAVKYSPEAAKIDIGTRKSKDRVIVSIKDFGIGMPEVTRKKVFERFFRDNDNTIPTSPGMGLGLVIYMGRCRKNNYRNFFRLGICFQMPADI